MIEILGSDEYLAAAVTTIGFVAVYFANLGACRFVRWLRHLISQWTIRKLRASVASVPAHHDAREKAVAGGACPPATARSDWPAAERPQHSNVGTREIRELRHGG